MEITEISIRLRNEPKLKAFVNVTFDNVFAIKGLKIIHSKKGFLLCMPSRRAEDGTQRDIAHPISRTFREKLEHEVLDEYKRAVKRAERGDFKVLDEEMDSWTLTSDRN